MFKEQTGKDPLELKYPMEDQSWINFRLDAITRVVNKITQTIKADGKRISAAVFPGPSMARKWCVRIGDSGRSMHTSR